MPDGRVIRVLTTLLAPPPIETDPLETGSLPTVVSNKAEGVTIPVLEERLLVSKRTVPTGKVQLKKTVETYQEALDEPLAIWTFDVERISLNQVVDAWPPVRLEGETTIYPLVEEQLVLTKQLILKEEVRVTKRVGEKRDTQSVTLRREQLSVVRTPIDKE
jgi:uncharacterized protein (TIGR02271 family)